MNLCLFIATSFVSFQENREKQLALRRQKIEDLRRRDSERRQAVEDRRKMKEEMERVSYPLICTLLMQGGSIIFFPLYELLGLRPFSHPRTIKKRT